MNTILQTIKDERAYQDKKWGISFDDKNTKNDWVTYITMYASQGAKMGESDARFRTMMLKVAALAVAAIEAGDRNEGYPPRHYD